MIGKTPDAFAFVVKNGPPNSNRNCSPRNPHLKCDRCNLVGHTTTNSRQHLKCDQCGYKGHTIDVCRKLMRANAQGDTKGSSHGFPRAHNVDFKSNKTKTTSSSYSLTIEQYHDLIELITQTKSVSTANQVSTMSNLSGLPPNSLTYDKGIR